MMVSRTNSLIAAVVLAVLIGYAFAAAQNVKSMPASGFLPETVTIRATMPDDGQVCAEPRSGGLVACRSVGEFRKWARERPAK